MEELNKKDIEEILNQEMKEFLMELGFIINRNERNKTISTILNDYE